MVKLLNARILMAVAMIVFVGAIAVSATGAFFSDTESSTGNTFTAGELDLKIDNTSYGFDWNRPGAEDPNGAWGPNIANTWTLRDLDNCGTEQEPQSCLFFNFIDLKPGDYGEDTISIHVQNDAWACMKMDLTATPENLVNEPEGDVPDETAGADEGELQNYLSFAFWNDDGDNVYENNEGDLLFNSFLADINEDWQPLADSGTGEPIPAMTGDEAEYIGKFWCFGRIAPTPVAPDDYGAPTADITGFDCIHLNPQDNIAQTDGVGVDVHFYSEQARHNDEFLCSSLNEEEPPPPAETASVMLDKAVSFTSIEIAGVDVSDFTLHIQGPPPGELKTLVDEVATSSLPLGIYTVTEVYSGDPAGITFNASFSGSCTEIDDTGTATMTLVAGANPTCFITNAVSPAS